MSTVKDHYDNHLGNLYSWMTGDLQSNVSDQITAFRKHGLEAIDPRTAVDLGSGNGIQALALGTLGYRVTAVDFNRQLNDELKRNIDGREIVVIEDDLTTFRKYENRPGVITCCGDTLAHLKSFDELKTLIDDCFSSLESGGILYVTFRDYSRELKNDERFIPVKQDHDRILTCFLEFFPDRVRVTDLLYEKVNDSWIQKVSSYEKLRISFDLIAQMFLDTGFKIRYSEAGRMNTIIGEKPGK